MKTLCYVLSMAAAMLLGATASAQDGRYSYTLYENSYQDADQKAAGGTPKAKGGVEDLPLKERGKKGPWMEEDSSDDPHGCHGNGNGKDDGNGCGDEGEDDDGCGDEGEDGGCGEEEEEDECKCDCYLFGPDEAVSYWDEMWAHCDDCCKPKISLGGWVQAGYNNKPTPLSMERGDGLSFNDVPNNLELHQWWLYAEKTLDDEKLKCGWDWGFRGDVIYGTDAQKTQAFGNTPDAAGNPRGYDNDWDHGVYGWALPQAYFEVGMGNLRVMAGKWYTKHGFEVVQATGNFFFSHSLTFFNSEPFSHTGVIAHYDVCDDLTVYGAYTLGWDTGFDSFNGDGHSYMGGFNAQLHEDISFGYVHMFGNFGQRGDDAYCHTLLLTMQLTDRVESVTQSDLLRVRTANDGTPQGDDDVGVVQYLFYTCNDCLKFGTRLEWWKDDGVSNYEATFGLNYRPHANFVVRPEYRHDWVPATDFREDIFAVDMIFTY